MAVQQRVAIRSNDGTPNLSHFCPTQPTSAPGKFSSQRTVSVISCDVYVQLLQSSSPWACPEGYSRLWRETVLGASAVSRSTPAIPSTSRTQPRQRAWPKPRPSSIRGHILLCSRSSKSSACLAPKDWAVCRTYNLAFPAPGYSCNSRSDDSRASSRLQMWGGRWGRGIKT